MYKTKKKKRDRSNVFDILVIGIVATLTGFGSYSLGIILELNIIFCIIYGNLVAALVGCLLTTYEIGIQKLNEVKKWKKKK